MFWTKAIIALGYYSLPLTLPTLLWDYMNRICAFQLGRYVHNILIGYLHLTCYTHSDWLFIFQSIWRLLVCLGSAVQSHSDAYWLRQRAPMVATAAPINVQHHWRALQWLVHRTSQLPNRASVSVTNLPIAKVQVPLTKSKTRKHSSRMRTARFCCWGSTFPDDAVLRREVRFQGGYDPGGMVGRHHTPPPPVNRLTDTRENITFPQLRLRAIKIHTKLLVVSVTELLTFLLMMQRICLWELNSLVTA